MNEDMVQGKWKQIRWEGPGMVGKLTEDDLDVINGKRDQLIGKVQERYGYTKDRATQEVDRRLEEFNRVSQTNTKV